jgi:hypothetical protein
MFALRLIGDAWYCGFMNGGPISANKLDDARHFDTREEVESELVLFAARCPRYIGKLSVKRIRAVRVQKRTAHVAEWKVVKRGGRETRVPARTIMNCEWVTRYVVKR